MIQKGPKGFKSQMDSKVAKVIQKWFTTMYFRGLHLLRSTCQLQEIGCVCPGPREEALFCDILWKPLDSLQDKQLIQNELLRNRSTHIFSITFQKLQRFCAGFGSRMSCETSQQQQIFQYEPKTSDFTEWHMKKFSQVSDVLCNDLSIESTIVQTCTRMPFRFEINHVIHHVIHI